MVQEAVRILLIAPFEELRTGMVSAVQSFPNIEMDTRVADMEDAIRIVQSLPDGYYDAIISRGGTAQMIRPIAALPVIEIRLGTLDILRGMQLAEKYGQDCAIAGFSNITYAAHRLCRLVGYDRKIITFQTRADIIPNLEQLQAEGCQAVLCDFAAHGLARKLGMNAFLLNSGGESMHEALTQAEEQGRLYRKMHVENQLMRRMLEQEGWQTAVIDETGRLIRALPGSPSQNAVKLLRGLMPEVLRGSTRFLQNFDGSLFNVTAEIHETRDHVRQVYFAWNTSQLPVRMGRAGLHSFVRAECEYMFASSFFAVSGAMGEASGKVDALSKARQPVMIYGETGTGKEQIARALYLRGPLSRYPFIHIDCARIDSRTFSYLIDHHSSPLSGNNRTVYFQHLHALSEEQLSTLMGALKDSGAGRRLRLIFSCDCRYKSAVPEEIHRFATQLECAGIVMPPLRVRQDELPSLAMQYLRTMNNENEATVQGFEPGAMDLLMRYDWPKNYLQFKQVLGELALLASSGYVGADAVASLLDRERTLMHETEQHGGGVELAGHTLEEITLEAIRQNIQACGGNHSKAAKQLGISRTTLWRFLARTEDLTLQEKNHEKE